MQYFRQKNKFVFASGCTDDIFSSDHSPVFATFEVGVTSQLSSKTGAVMVENTHKKKTDELWLSPLCWPNIVVVPFVWWLRSKSGRGEGLDRAGRNRGHSEDVEQGQVLHRVPLLLPRRFVAGSSSKQILWFEQLGTEKAHCCFLVQVHGVQVWMTRRAPTFPGFSDWDGPSNSCRRLELQVCLEMSKKHKMLDCTLYPLSLFFFFSFFLSCLTWRASGINTCSSLSSHVMALSHMVGAN